MPSLTINCLVERVTEAEGDVETGGGTGGRPREGTHVATPALVDLLQDLAGRTIDTLFLFFFDI